MRNRGHLHFEYLEFTQNSLDHPDVNLLMKPEIMTKKVKIIAGSVTMLAELNDTPTAQAIWDILPIHGSANIWGDEIYFGLPITLDKEENANAEVDIGALAYWPPGSAFCIFWGPTPASSGPQPCAASPVNVFGHINGDATEFDKVRNGESIEITAA